MNQIAIILYSNPKDPSKSVIPNNKKIVLECDNLEILEDIRHKLQYETDICHFFSAGALIQVSQKTKTVFKYIYDNYHCQLPRLMQLVKYLEKFEEGEMFYYFDGERSSIEPRLTAIRCLPYFPTNGFVKVIHNKFFHYYIMMGFMFKHYSFGFDDIECKVGEEDKNKRCCRFCNSTGKSNFRHIAHAIPEALGNKLLFCNDECDSCNSKLASVENNFVHMMDIRRVLHRVPSKKTSKAISLYGENYTILTDGEQGIPILYVKKEMLTPLGDGRYSYRLKNSSEVSNEGIYKALVKMVLDLVPKSELDHFRNTIVWINGNQIDPILPSVYYAIRSEGEKFYMQPRLDLFFNTQQNFRDSPYCTAILYTTDVQYIFVVPFVDIDRGQFKYNDQLIGHWKRMFEMLHQREWIEQNTSDTHPAYTWLDFEFSINDKTVRILDGTDNIFKKYKTEEEKWKLNNYQFPKFNQEMIVVEGVSDIFFENLCNRKVSQKELSDVSVNFALGDSYVKMDVPNKRICVRLGFEAYNSDNTIPFFKCSGMVILVVKSMDKFIKITEDNGGYDIEMDWSFHQSVVLQSARVIEAKMKKQRIGTPFSNCSFEMAFDNEMVIRRILVSFV